ncbi:hypothetical protein H6H01_01610 [Nostoc calcicola FACHB-3891]|nr:hypothetical protein [Nostoc calcicola FACHB-3891]
MKSDAPASLTDLKKPYLQRQLLSDARRQERTGSTFVSDTLRVACFDVGVRKI